jgi:hypothetical protein
MTTPPLVTPVAYPGVLTLPGREGNRSRALAAMWATVTPHAPASGLSSKSDVGTSLPGVGTPPEEKESREVR